MKPPQDGDGRLKRTGKILSASACIITAVIGPEVLSSSWAIAQLGWVFGPTAIFLFSFVTYYTSTRLTACCRGGDHVAKQYTYMDAVRAKLGDFQAKLFGTTQYLNLFGVTIGCTITASISMMEIQRSNCFHSKGVNIPCEASTIPYKIAFGVMEIILLQIPNFNQISWLSIVSAIMPFIYSTIVLGLGIAKVAGVSQEKISRIIITEAGEFKGSLTGISVGTVTKSQKIFRSFQAIGSLAFAYSYSFLLEIEDTLKSSQSDHKTTKKATLASLSITTIFYMLCGCIGYAAFGDMSPGNLLLTADFGDYNPYWLLSVANAALVIHHIGAYQVCCQPIFAFIEEAASKLMFPNSRFINENIRIRIPIPGLKKTYKLNLVRLFWRSIFVIITTIISMFMPFFNDAIGVLGAFGNWCLTVSFPLAVYITEEKIQERSGKWICLQILSMSCLLISIAGAVGSFAG